MASAKREAMNRLGSEDDYIGLSSFNKEREAAQKSYDTSINSLQNEYNNMLKTMANNRASTQKDFSKGRASVRENSFMNTRNDLADLASRGISGGGLQQLSKLGNRMETGRQYSDLANTYYNTMNEISDTERQGTDSYNINREIASNDLATQLAGIGTREANARNAYRQAVANLAEQIQARRDAAAAASAQLRLQKEQYKQNQYLTLVDKLKAALGDDKGVTNVGKVATDYSKLISQYLGKNIGRSDAMKWMYEQGLYDPNTFTSSSKTTKNTSTNNSSTNNNKSTNRVDNTTFGNRIRKTNTNTNRRTDNTTFGNRIRK